LVFLEAKELKFDVVVEAGQWGAKTLKRLTSHHTATVHKPKVFQVLIERLKRWKELLLRNAIR
jgi:hypothetical protein